MVSYLHHSFLTNCTDQSPSWEARNHLTQQPFQLIPPPQKKKKQIHVIVIESINLFNAKNEMLGLVTPAR